MKPLCFTAQIVLKWVITIQWTLALDTYRPYCKGVLMSMQHMYQSHLLSEGPVDGESEGQALQTVVQLAGLGVS